MHPSVEAWKEVRKQRTFERVVLRAEDWLGELWPAAKKLRLTPYGKRVETYREDPPRIVVSTKLASEHMACYWAHEHAHGPLIRISPERNWREWAPYDAENLPFLGSLRWAILHEVQHALDDCYGVWSIDHDSYFQRRLSRMAVLFPVTTT